MVALAHNYLIHAINGVYLHKNNVHLKIKTMKQLLISLLIISSFFSYSQTPTKIDDKYCRTTEQEREVVKTYQQKDLLDTLYNDCKSENNALKDAVTYQAKVINDQSQIIAKTELISSKKDVIINAKDSDLKAEKKKNRKLQVRNVLTTSLGGVSLIGNIVLVVKLIGF